MLEVLATLNWDTDVQNMRFNLKGGIEYTQTLLVNGVFANELALDRLKNAIISTRNDLELLTNQVLSGNIDCQLCQSLEKNAEDFYYNG